MCSIKKVAQSSHSGTLVSQLAAGSGAGDPSSKPCQVNNLFCCYVPNYSTYFEYNYNY